MRVNDSRSQNAMYNVNFYLSLIPAISHEYQLLPSGKPGAGASTQDLCRRDSRRIFVERLVKILLEKFQKLAVEGNSAV